MWEPDWALLGIEPTTELGAIKKAYALKLKVTRPDDDAQAYQALRGAYERAQQWVKWQQQELPETVEAEPVLQPEVAHMPLPAPTPEADPAPPAEMVDVAPALLRAPTPEELVDATEQHRQQGGSLALVRALPGLLQELSALPVGREEAASQAFAHWVLQHPDVPLDVLAALDAHFGWRGDYRTERALGADLCAALQTELDLRMPVPITDSGLIEEAAPLLGLEQLRHHRFGDKLVLLLGALCVHSLQRLRTAFGDRLLRGLGLSPSQQIWLDNALMVATVMRGLAPAALFAFAAYAVLDDWEKAVRFVGLSFAAVFGFLLLMKGGGLLLWWDHRKPEDAYFAGLAVWRSRQTERVGLGLIVAGAVIAEVVGLWAAAWLAGALGLMIIAAGIVTLRWGRSLDHSRALAGCLVAAALVMWSALGTPLRLSACVALGALWTYLGWVLYDGRHPKLNASPLAWLVRPLTNTLALCERWGWGFASWPLLLISAVALSAGHSGSLLIEWGLWSISAFLLFIGQNAIDNVCHRWLARQVGIVR